MKMATLGNELGEKYRMIFVSGAKKYILSQKIHYESKEGKSTNSKQSNLSSLLQSHRVKLKTLKQNYNITRV